MQGKSSLERLFKAIDEGLRNHQKCFYQNRVAFEYKLDRSFGIITEDIDAFIQLIEKPWSANIGKLMDYLKSAPQGELTDWVSALEIAVLDRGQQDRWTLSLVRKSSEVLPLSKESLAILIGILEAMQAAPWSPTGEAPV